ncbi:DUF7507 domain-containing protein [Flavobacterium aestivum]|uniref:DUF7507 domain-containing protein n=1 Tax=Flavobacterium aestivum TaxID=3003257 RepID=UPI0024829707|nr:gliding motility-associated C-terminal domain-containing protein [Flavobacterium aestivum]
MKKNYKDLSINQSNQSITLKTLIQRTFKRAFLFFVFYVCSATIVSAQCNTETPLPFINSTFGNLTATGSLSGVCVLCSATNAPRLIDADLNNFATANVTVGVSGSVDYRVTDTDTDYTAGTYVGYRIDTGALLNTNLLSSITIRTYLNGVLKETTSGPLLLGQGLLNGTGNNYVVGFNTTQDFDAIEISIGGLVGLSNIIDVYYPVIRNYCAGPALGCNTVSAMNLPTYPVSLEPTHTGVSGTSVGSVYDVTNCISSNTNDYATIALTAGIAGSGSISVKDQLTDYPSGTYAGFEIENSNLLNASALGNIVITTYRDGVQQQQLSGSNLVVGGSLLNNPGRYKVGFVSTTSFDEARISVNQTLALNLGSTKVYSAVFENFCAGPDLVCNTQTVMSAPTYPVYINGVNTGIDGLVCALCTINNAENLIDSNTTNYAQISLTASIGNSGSISIKDEKTDYPIGSFVGFTVENAPLLNVNALDAVTLRTYLNGVLQETKSGNSALAIVGTSNSTQTIGFVSTKSFDEARITITNTATVTLGVVNVYNVVFEKLCPVTLECNRTYPLTNPAFPVIIDSDKTGIDGVACVACVVNNTNNVLTADTTDFATIMVTAGVISTASIAVLDQLTTYPAGTFAGFTIKDLNSLAQLDLFNSLTVYTYLDGVLKESKSSALLTNVPILAPYVSGTAVYNVGFKTSQAFDEIRISLGSLANEINNINVYGAFVNTAGTSGGSLQCAVIDAVNDVLPPTVGATGNVNAGNVLTNDTLNGTPVNISDIILTSVPNGPLTVNADGSVTVAPNTPGGTYTVNYTICEKLNPTNCDTATVTIFVTAPSIALVKVGAVGGTGAVGDVITYTFTVTNTGNTTLTNVVINDALTNSVNLAVTPSTLAPNETGTATATYTIIQADVDAGKVTNSATVTGTTPTSGTVTDTSGTTINNDTPTETTLTPNPSIALVKTGAVGGTGIVGDVITYTFTVTNTGNTVLTNVVVNDALTNSVNLAVTPSTLAPNATGTATATYTIIQADVDAGKVINSATVTGTTPTSGTVTDISGTAINNNTPTETTLVPNPSIAVVKTGTVGGTGAVGYLITYTFTVTNTGNTTLTNVVVNDALTNSVNLAVSPSTLIPNATGTATATYTIQQSDIDAGKVTNSATVTGTTPTNGTVTDTSGTTILNNTPTETTLTQNPSIAVVKTGVVGGTGAVGDVITYTFTVTNTGNTTLNSIIINDALTNSVNLAVSPSTLAPNATGTATATYTIQQSDIDAGKVTNSATVTGTTPTNGTVTDTSGTTILNNTPTETTLTRSPSIAMVKVGAVGGTGGVGDLLTYTFTVTNTGNTTLTNIVVNDALTNSVNLAVTPSTLAPNATGTATATYTIIQADVDAGKVTNSATVTGTTPTSGTVTDTSGTTINNDTPTETTLIPNPSIALVKTGVVGGTGAVGDVITYTFTVTNTGNTNLTNIHFSDALTNSVNMAVTPSTLVPNATGTATATYTIQQSDIDAGKVTNTATVTGTTPTSGTVSDTSGTTILNDTPTETSLTQSSSIAMVKVGTTGGTGAVGDVITYTFTVTNTGNTTLTNIIVSDALTNSLNLTVTPSTLAPNATGTATATYTIQQSDIDTGKVTNSATVTGTTPTSGTVTDTSGTTILNDTPTETILTPSPSIALVKTGAVGGTGAVGDVITYTFTVTNTGNSTLTNIIVNDALTNSVNLAILPSTLAPNATGTVTATYTIKQSDIDAGKVTNSATVTATTPTNGTVTDTSGSTILNDSPTVTALNSLFSIKIMKEGIYEDKNHDGIANEGDVINYAFTITNTGNSALNNVTIKDDNVSTVKGFLHTLAVGASDSVTFTAVYMITNNDIKSGYVYNSAIVSAISPANTTISAISTDPTPCLTCPVDSNCLTCTITAIAQSPSIAIVKKAVFNDNNGDGYGEIGETIGYSFTVMNTGNLPLTNVVLTDALPGIVISGGPISLGIGESNSTSFSGIYVLTQQDIIKGSVTNQAMIKGVTPSGAEVSDMSDDTSPLEDDPTILSINSCSLEVFNAVSPDGDGLNDFFRIRGIECYPKNTVEIYNRWGVKVYDAKGYNNDTIVFRGISDGRATIDTSEGLPSGTYFYVVKYEDFNGNGIDQSGYLDLNRN